MVKEISAGVMKLLALGFVHACAKPHIDTRGNFSKVVMGYDF
jgi:hypothetical protein